MRQVAAGAAALGAATALAVLHWGNAPALAAAAPAVAVPAWLWSRSVTRRDRELAELRRVAEAVQQALLRPVPKRLGDLRTEVRYLAADAAAEVGGDLYDVLSTPFGTRLIIGDVSGKGLEAVSGAADVLGAFRELARREPSLAAVAMRLDALVRDRLGGAEGFVTALLVGLPKGDRPAEIVHCGHPPPLLLRDGRAACVEPVLQFPPLGLLELAGGWCAGEPLPLRPGDRLLLYTDGVSEARDGEGMCYPLARRVEELARGQEGHCPGRLLTALERDLRRHTGGRPADDAALLLVQLEAVPPVRPHADLAVRRAG
ncbi:MULTISPECIES: PP2C family protein-serine/threonine phosphatase [Thermomonospora]|uniref:Protein serine/threonine phosphatase n=1 Tax=Thermomonospora curvata (strain ATCC 19995 / DSM 43183 / JCM 3096 / KCTC 9072 / NBRC 15933 / NCIMB 10081 / Henssen B9) TaxID=471852 RepID=D1ACJ4_THECD|nr:MULTISPECIES: PP2C family protein-serine/threonine phosphatase [Thermomonospora]ACY99253.1 protein serine/threonine phosphatase [Thermomonospora curvata DSM 43183]PKK12316.1 MAG: serine/threonine-protein phosphatase [Thermomonospora sp. CIF 1]